MSSLRANMWGGYLSKKTPLHRVDARLKIAFLLVTTLVLFVVPSWLVVLICALLMAAGCRVSGVSARELVRAARPAAFMLVFVVIANAFAFDGTAAIPLGKHFGLSPSGALRGAFSVSRILLLIGFSLLVSSTTSASELADAFSWIISPLARFGVPVDDFAMIISLSLRFIPITVEELDRIRRAQTARGLDLSTGTLRERLAKWTSVFIPLIVSLFRRADELADAMRDRGWGTGKRTIIQKLN